jgi:hypothetical protein
LSDEPSASSFSALLDNSAFPALAAYQKTQWASCGFLQVAPLALNRSGAYRSGALVRFGLGPGVPSAAQAARILPTFSDRLKATPFQGSNFNQSLLIGGGCCWRQDGLAEAVADSRFALPWLLSCRKMQGEFCGN